MGKFAEIHADRIGSNDGDLARIAELEAALAPFAAYMRAMDAYATLHRGKHLPDSKILAYSQTEMGTCGALCVGHFRDAKHVMADQPLPGWSGQYRSPVRAHRQEAVE